MNIKTAYPIFNHYHNVKENIHPNYIIFSKISCLMYIKVDILKIMFLLLNYHKDSLNLGINLKFLY